MPLIFERLRDYFQNIAEVLQGDKAASTYVTVTVYC